MPNTVKMKFDESKVINALHVKDAEQFKTGMFADDIYTLRSHVVNKHEVAFGDLEIIKEKLNPFKLVNSTGSGKFQLFYPVTINDLYGTSYVDYLKAYEDINSEIKMSYSEYKEFVRTDKPLHKYIFSGSSKRTDWLDGEIYDANIEFDDEYGPEHGKTGKATLVVTAPDPQMAKISAGYWFDHVGGWHKSGCNYHGNGWVDSNTFSNRRYFGEFDVDKNDKELIKSIPLFDTIRTNNLDGKVSQFNYLDVLNTDSFYWDVKLDDKSYPFERNLIVSGKETDTVSLKSKVKKAFKDAGIDYQPIFEREASYLLKDFDTTMNAIFASIKAFDGLDKDYIKSLKNKIKDAGHWNLVRPPVRMKGGKDVNSGKIFAVTVLGDGYSKPFYDTSYYANEYSRTNKSNESFSKPWCLVKRGVKVDSLKNTELSDCWFKTYNNRDVFYNWNVLTDDNYVFIPDDKDLSRWDRIEDMKPAAKFLEWNKVADDLTELDVYNLRMSTHDHYGYTFIDLTVNTDTVEGHKCIKVSVETYTGSMSFREPYRFSNYKDILNCMYSKGYHFVKSVNFDESDESNEKFDLCFVKNKNGQDYSNTVLEDYWNKNGKPKEKSIWD